MSLPLPVGSPGKVGFVTLAFAPVRGLTRLVTSRYQIPFQVMRAMHYDSDEPTMAYVTVVSPVGGVVQGDRLSLSATARTGSAAHITTASATNIYSMELDEGRLAEEFVVEADAYLEYLPDQLIPHRTARYRQETRFIVDPAGCLLYGETLLPGRIHMDDELFQYDWVDLGLRAERPDGTLLFADRLHLEPGRDDCRRIGRMGALPVMTSLYVLCPPSYQGALRTALDSLDFEPPEGKSRGQSDLSSAGVCPPEGALVGVTELPAQSGLMLRGLTADTILASRLLKEAWRAARQVLRGTPIPAQRKY